MTTSGQGNQILVFDAGTQSIRAALIDLRGEIRHMVKTPITPYFSHQPGWAEQELDYYWQSFAATCRRLFDTEGVASDRIAGVTVTSQRATMVNLDINGTPLRPAILWLDQRKAEMKGHLSPLFTGVLKTVNQYGIVDKAIRESKSNWLIQNQPDIWEKTHKFLFLSGYWIHRLTGEYRDSVGSQVGYVPFDYKRHCWAGPRDLKWKFFPMDPTLLPELVPPGGLLGHITRQACQETGIPEGLPVIAAATDKACEVLGAGCRSPETACLSYGTTATVTGVNATSASTYELTVSGGDLADFNGTVGLDLAAGQDIADLVGNTLTTAEPAADETYSVANNQAPDAVDDAVTHVLTARFRLGMFDPPEQVPYAQIPHDIVDSPEHRALAEKTLFEGA